MKIKTSHGEFNIREMKFPDRRKLHRMEIQTVATDGDVNQEKFFDILDNLIISLFSIGFISLKSLRRSSYSLFIF